MPGFDGTGPRGMGPMTGGGRGFCASAFGVGRPLAGARMFFGRGGGRGWRNRYYATGLTRWQRWAPWGIPPTAEDEKQALKSEADFLRSRLQVLEERLAAMNEEGK
ncbi:MAG: hypothetical protein A4E67_02197 [Syntrophaceae bacterium PtaB.Bin038]|nr:MAG: hypothetical protein A4E67_02197 [Syntrophaceae bacterium PtaB.Bin038]